MIALVLNHLWQSSLCVAGAGLIALALRRNGANVRFWVWFAASIKFLVPFAALAALSASLLTPIVPPLTAPTVNFIEPLAKPFSGSPATSVATGPVAETSTPLLARRVPPPTRSQFPLPHLDLKEALLALWATGFLVLALRWFVRWFGVRALLHEAVEAKIDLPVAVKISAARLEPGLFGILHPVILLPQGIERQLTAAELEAVLAHELCHWRRRDNLLAAIHMLVEALFWFFPLVWWLGARLNAERERACDESVLAAGNDPQLYAEGILKVCRAYLQSPLACVAGVSGADLKNRIETIAENRLIPQLNAARKFVLSASAAAALALPLALGLMTAPVAQLQAKAAPNRLPRAQRSSEQAPSRAPETPALPTGGIADGSAERQARLEATTANSATPSSPQPSKPSPMALPPAPQSVSSNDLPALPAQIQPSNSGTQTVALLDRADHPTGASNQEDTMFKQTLTAAVALLGLNGAAEAQAPARTCALPSLVDTAPLERVAGTDLVTVPVKIDGTSKQFLLDIGTNPTEISQAAVTQLGLPENNKIGETIGGEHSVQAGLAAGGSDLGALTNGGLGNVAVHDARDDAGRGATQTRVRIGAFTIGGATAHNMIFGVANDADMGKTQSEPYDGLMTGAFFKQYDVELDFSGKQINWLTPTKCTDPDQVAFWPHSAVGVIPMTIANGKIRVPVTAEGHAITAVIDTSSARTVMRRDIAELLMGLNDADMKLDPDLKDGKGQPVYVHTFSQIAFAGGVTANNVPALILTNSLTHEMDSGMILGSRARSADAPIPDLTLGMDVLHQLHMYIVPGQGKLYVTSAE